MLDIQFIRDNADLVQTNARNKNIDVDIGRLLELDSERRTRLTQIEELRARRNTQSAGVQGPPSADQIEAGKQLKEEIAAREADLQTIETVYEEILKQVPNMALADVPVGASEDENVVAKTVGEPTQFDFEPRNHAELAEAKGWLDKERAAKVAGARFAYLKGDLVKMQFAIVQFVLDTLTNEETLAKIAEEAGLQVSTKPFEPILPPALVGTTAYQATCRLDAEEVTYKLADDELWLNASAEHSLCNMFMDETIAEADLPLRFIGYATSFRREAGSYGKDMEGIIRMHQFDKLEMESFTTAAYGLDEHLFMIAIQEYLVKQLGLPYQLLQKCTADIGKPNARGVDLEVWFPSQGKYRETHTADYMTDYQARRLKTRVRLTDGQTSLVHTNDATAFALGRTMAAILENYQTADGDVLLPEALKPYMH
jgi:seryl-tRNA synthetase